MLLSRRHRKISVVLWPDIFTHWLNVLKTTQILTGFPKDIAIPNTAFPCHCGPTGIEFQYFLLLFLFCYSHIFMRKTIKMLLRDMKRFTEETQKWPGRKGIKWNIRLLHLEMDWGTFLLNWSDVSWGEEQERCEELLKGNPAWVRVPDSGLGLPTKASK